MNYRFALLAVCLSSTFALPTAEAQVDLGIEKSSYQNAVAAFSWSTDCATMSLQVGTGRTFSWSLGQPRITENAAFVRYFMEDRCAAPTVRRYSGSAEVADVAEFARRMEGASAQLEVEMQGSECTLVSESSTCAPRTIPLVLTVSWVGEGDIATLGGTDRQHVEGFLGVTRSYWKSRAASASAAGTIDGEIVDLTNDAGSLVASANRSIYLTWPAP